MHYEKVNYSLNGGVARIAMNDPATRNAGSVQMGEELHELRRVVAANKQGQLDARCNVARFEGTYRELMVEVNQMLDLLIEEWPC